MRIAYEPMPHWPRLAWLAEGAAGDDALTVRHGRWLETRPEWFCEAVWDAPFAAGDFDRTAIVAGTGARVRGGALRFVSAGTNVDRLHTFRRGDRFYVSNSLSCLMAWIDAEPDLTYGGYVADFAAYRYAILEERVRTIPTTAGPVDMTYFADLAWNGERFDLVEKPVPDVRFEDYAAYVDHLRDVIGRLAANAADGARERTFRLLCPISSGYDSPAIAALAREVAAPVAFTFRTDREGVDDSGEAIAEILGIPCRVVDRDAWRRAPLAEVPFVACSGSVGDVAFRGAEDILEGTVFLNGLGAGALWETKSADKERPEFGDGNMLGLLEYRLDAGFFQYPLPLVGVHRMEDVVALTRSEELAPWDVGGAYSKPICRRIVEDAGVPRDAFGVSKKGVSEVPLRGEFLAPPAQRDFLAWLGARGADAGGRLPSPRTARALDAVLTPVARAVRTAEQVVPDGNGAPQKAARRGLAFLRRRLRAPYYHHAYVTHWAMDRARDRYRAASG